MYCIKTGARAYIYELGAIVAADIFRVGEDALVIHWNKQSADYMGPGEARAKGATHFVLQAPHQSDDWKWDDHGVMVTQRRFVEGHLHG